MRRIGCAVVGLVVSMGAATQGAEWHVSVNGRDANSGSADAPLRTVQRAADLAQPGDVVTVHAGVYRERVNPPRGGASEARRIVYQAAPGEKVAIKGSEVVKGWVKATGDVWSVTLTNSLFGGFNPFADVIRGDWFNPKGRIHHTGAVYLNGEWLAEAASLEDVLGTGAPVAPRKRTGNVLLNVATFSVGSGSGAGERRSAALFAAAHEGVKKAPCSEGGECIGWIEDGDWVRYDGVNAGGGGGRIELRVASATSGGQIELHQGTPDGALLGTVAVPRTGGWQTWTSVGVTLTAGSAAENLCMVFRAPLAQLKRAPLWFARVDGPSTTIWAQFKGVDPNEQLVEINVRQSVFYPDKPGRNYITVRGFTLTQAATPWAPPTAEQVGLVGTHWSKGWVIENNVISHSVCSGVALGKHGDEFDNTSANSAEGYVKTIERAHAFSIPWTREAIGHHLVRSNTIFNCEQAGVVGSLGCAFSTVTGNTIHDIHVRQLFTGAEMAGIKLHGAIDVEISNNRIYRTCRGLWLDWMAQGTRVTRNLFYNNTGEDVFVEVNHGPFLFDNNLLLSAVSLLDWSEGGAYAHNLLMGRISCAPELNRATPFHPAHATAVAGLCNIKGGGDRFYNNVFVGKPGAANGPRAANATAKDRFSGYGLWVYDTREEPLQTGGNLYFGDARPYASEVSPTVRTDGAPSVEVVDEGDAVLLQLNGALREAGAATALVDTARLGKAKIPQVAYERADGTPLCVDADFGGRRRDLARPMPGPFELSGAGDGTLKLGK